MKTKNRQSILAAVLVGALGAIISHAETVETLALSAGIPVT